MARLLNLDSRSPVIEFTKKELDLMIKPYIDNLRIELEDKFNKIENIAEGIQFLLNENKEIRTQIRNLNGNQIRENQNKIDILLESLKKDFKISVKDESDHWNDNQRG